MLCTLALALTTGSVLFAGRAYRAVQNDSMVMA